MNKKIKEDIKFSLKSLLAIVGSYIVALATNNIIVGGCIGIIIILGYIIPSSINNEKERNSYD